MLNIYNLPSNFTGYQAREWVFSAHIIIRNSPSCFQPAPPSGRDEKPIEYPELDYCTNNISCSNPSNSSVHTYQREVFKYGINERQRQIQAEKANIIRDNGIK